MDSHLENLPTDLKKELLKFVPDYEDLAKREMCEDIFAYVRKHRSVPEGIIYHIVYTEHRYGYSIYIAPFNAQYDELRFNTMLFCDGPIDGEHFPLKRGVPFDYWLTV